MISRGWLFWLIWKVLTQALKGHRFHQCILHTLVFMLQTRKIFKPGYFDCFGKISRSKQVSKDHNLSRIVYFSTYRILGGAHPLLFINLQDFRGVPVPHFYVILEWGMGTPLKSCRLMKSEGWAPYWVDTGSKKCQIQMVQMTKNLVHSFYYILYQSKGVPIP